MSLGIVGSIALLLVLLSLFYFFMRLGDAYSLNRHRKRYINYDDPSKKGGDLRNFERGIRTKEFGISNLEGERDSEGQFLLPPNQIESGTKEDTSSGGDKRLPKRFKILRRRNRE